MTTPAAVSVVGVEHAWRRLMVTLGQRNPGRVATQQIYVRGIRAQVKR